MSCESKMASVWYTDLAVCLTDIRYNQPPRMGWHSIAERSYADEAGRPADSGAHRRSAEPAFAIGNVPAFDAGSGGSLTATPPGIPKELPRICRQRRIEALAAIGSRSGSPEGVQCTEIRTRLEGITGGTAFLDTRPFVSVTVMFSNRSILSANYPCCQL